MVDEGSRMANARELGSYATEEKEDRRTAVDALLSRLPDLGEREPS